jgi:cell division transport system permease protein
MRALDYALRQGWIGLWRARGAALFAIAAIALALVVLGALLLVIWNLQRAAAQMADAAELSVFLQDHASSEQRGAIEAWLDQSGLVHGREYVSKVAARARFAQQAPDLAALTADLDRNPFPASIEVRLRADADAGGRAGALVAALARMPGVEDVRYDRELLATLDTGVRAIVTAGGVLVLVMTLAAAVTVAAVVRLGLQARRDEIEIMELVGAPLAYIRGPFIAEGVLQGGIGASLALLAIGGGFLAFEGWWGRTVAAALAGAGPEFLPLSLCLLIVLGGMLVGGAGGFVASRHAGFTSVIGR